MDDNRLEVPYIVYEGEQARHERTIKRLIIALVIAVIVTLLSNVAWLIYLSGYEFYTEDNDVMVEAKDGIANFIGHNGDITNGEDKSQNADQSSGQEEWESARD